MTEHVDQTDIWQERVRSIAREVCREHGVTLEEILAKYGKRHIAVARAAAIARAHGVTGYSLSALGEVFERCPKSIALVLWRAREGRV